MVCNFVAARINSHKGILMNAEIRNCIFRFKCTKTWEDLKETTEKTKRFCNHCGETVHYCKTSSELRKAIIKNYCVAVEMKKSESSEITVMLGDVAC